MKARKKGELFWPAIVMKKWLNIKPREEEFSADEKDTESEFDDEETSPVERGTVSKNDGSHTISRFQANGTPSESFLWRLKRGKSVTMRSQYIDTKEIKILVGTWNVGGRLPPDDLDIEEWLDAKDPADVYVLGFQEVVPLNAGNIFGAEDNIPVLKWEDRLRSTLNKTQPNKSKCKCYSAPPSPSRVNASDLIVDEILSENDVPNEDVSISPHQGDIPVDVANDPIYPSNLYNVPKKLSSNLGSKQATWPEELLNSELHHSESNVNLRRVCSDSERNKSGYRERQLDSETQTLPSRAKLRRIYSMSEKISLSWPEQPLDLKTEDSLPNVSSFKKIHLNEELRNCLETFSVTDAGAKSKNPKSVRAGYVRIVGKQMVGIFVSVWVRRSLRRHINNLKVSPIGVGVMGYIGNKVSVNDLMNPIQ